LEDQLERLWLYQGVLHDFESAEGLMLIRARRPVGKAIFS
jgi:hypothetical protein